MAGRRGLPGGASSPARLGVTDSPRSLRIFADQLSETAQVTDAGRLTYAGVAGEPKLAPLRRVSVGFSPYGRLRETLGLVPMRMVSVLIALEVRPSTLVTG